MPGASARGDGLARGRRGGNTRCRGGDSRQADRPTEGARDMKSDNYKWIALSNTTLGILMAVINQSIVIIALPAI
ncbi:MAG: hypothetical protein ACTHMY_17745, partial [Solirubrobacteraceae bacterium]